MSISNSILVYMGHKAPKPAERTSEDTSVLQGCLSDIGVHRGLYRQNNNMLITDEGSRMEVK